MVINKPVSSTAMVTFFSLILGLFSRPSSGYARLPIGRPNYPPSKKEQIADTLFGKIIPDPYRWLENTDDPEVAQWTDQQNSLTRSILDNLPQRAKIKTRLKKLWDCPRQGLPEKCDTRYFLTKNDGLQNHSVLYAFRQHGEKPKVVIDPNAWSADGTEAMDYWVASKTGRYVAYGRSSKGQERGVLFIRDVATNQDLPDTITDTSYPSIAWLKNDSGFFYTRNPAKGTVPPGDENYFEKIYFHRLGQPMTSDELIYERPDIKELGFGVQLAETERYLVIYAYYGSSSKNEVYYKDLSRPGEMQTLVSGFHHQYTGQIIDSVLFLQTDEGAPNFRIVAVDLTSPAKENWKTIVPECDDIIESFKIINRRLVVLYLRRACSAVKIFDLQGRLENEIQLPDMGTVYDISGRWDDDEMYLGFSSFVYPWTTYRYDFATGRLSTYYRTPVAVDSKRYVTRQVWYTSRDGTPISMFIVHRKGIKFDGGNPVYLYGYGGFNASMTPSFSPARLVWLENGGVYAMPNLRGGGEYGQKWHEAGMLDKKQNVFDDFIAAAEWLIANGYTNPAKLAISGASNGGLLVGAVMVQRPELFKAVICGAPLLDMVRYHLFNIARYWIPEYGTAEDPSQLEYLLAYSPYHNVKPGIAYPAALFQSGETDWRTHPLHARKMVAALQQATSSDAPILLDMERRTGHGWGTPLSMRLEKIADEYAFLFWQLGMK